MREKKLKQFLWQDCVGCNRKNDPIENIIEDEENFGFQKVQDILYTYLTDADFTPLPELLGEELSKLNPKKHIAFIVRAGCLAPHLSDITIDGSYAG